MRNVKNVPSEPYKEGEFEAFLKLLNKGQFDTWEMVAESLGVHPNTIKSWKKHPLAKKAIADGIQSATEKMESVGRRDWRMWREKIDLLNREKPHPEDKGTTNNLLLIGNDKLTNDILGLIGGHNERRVDAEVVEADAPTETRTLKEGDAGKSTKSKGRSPVLPE